MILGELFSTAGILEKKIAFIFNVLHFFIYKPLHSFQKYDLNLYFQLTDVWKTVLVVLYCVTFAVGILGNISVLIILLVNKVRLNNEATIALTFIDCLF